MDHFVTVRAGDLRFAEIGDLRLRISAVSEEELASLLDRGHARTMRSCRVELNIGANSRPKV